MKLYETALLLMCLTGCTRSMVFSPSLNLPSDPTKNSLQLYGGASMLAETRPREVNRSASLGVDGFVRFGASDRVSLQVKSWEALRNVDEHRRTGISAGALVRLGNNSADWAWGLMTQGGFVFAGGGTEGGGIAMSGVLWMPRFLFLRPYSAFGLAWGQRNSEEWGWGLISNLGVNSIFLKHFTVNAEISPVYESNRYDRYRRLILSPSVGLSIQF
jgi:hypothetical protein